MPLQYFRTVVPVTTTLESLQRQATTQKTIHTRGTTLDCGDTRSVAHLTLGMDGRSDPAWQQALELYKAKLVESREWETKLKTLRLEIKDLQKDFDKTEDNIKALQSVGQIIGEVLKQLDDERCTCVLLGLEQRTLRADQRAPGTSSLLCCSQEKKKRIADSCMARNPQSLSRRRRARATSSDVDRRWTRRS